jgi:hypothetical protein
MLGLDELCFLEALHLWAYIGLGPGQEFIPYFLTLLTFVGAALVAVVQWPLAALLRLFRSKRNVESIEVDKGSGMTDASLLGDQVNQDQPER